MRTAIGRDVGVAGGGIGVSVGELVETGLFVPTAQPVTIKGKERINSIHIF